MFSSADQNATQMQNDPRPKVGAEAENRWESKRRTRDSNPQGIAPAAFRVRDREVRYAPPRSAQRENTSSESAVNDPSGRRETPSDESRATHSATQKTLAPACLLSSLYESGK